MNTIDNEYVNSLFDTKEACISFFNNVQNDSDMRSKYIADVLDKSGITPVVDGIESLLLNEDGTVNHNRYKKVLIFMTFMMVSLQYIGDNESLANTITELIKQDNDTIDEFMVKLASTINSHLNDV